jgi:hypothetical protein
MRRFFVKPSVKAMQTCARQIVTIAQGSLAILSFAVSAANVCTLTQTSSGVMKTNLSGTAIGSVQAGGISGSITVSCDTTGTITVENPIAVGLGAVNAFATGANYGADVSQSGSVKASISRSNSSTTANIPSGVYQVNAYIDNATALPPGDYAVTVITVLVAN